MTTSDFIFEHSLRPIADDHIVAPWIDFDDYKAFEEVLMIFA